MNLVSFLKFTLTLVHLSVTSAHEVKEQRNDVSSCKSDFPGRNLLYLQADTTTICNVKDLFVYCHERNRKHIKYLWTGKKFHIDTSDKTFTLYIGHSYNDVLNKYNNAPMLATMWWQPRYTDVQLSVFNETCVGVTSSEEYKVTVYVRFVDHINLLLLLAGIALFYWSPKLAKSTVLYYTSGTAIGIFASLLILIFVMSRILPMKRYAAFAFIASGWSVCLYFMNALWEDTRDVLYNYEMYVISYIVIVGTISLSMCYRFASEVNIRTVNLIKWGMQVFSVILVYLSTELKEAVVPIIMVMLCIRYFPYGCVKKLMIFYRVKFPQKPQLLTEEEYQNQTFLETRKSLYQLRKFCSTPESEPWKLVQKLKAPSKFAEFMNSGSHLDESEIQEYESELELTSNLMTDDDSSESY